MAAATRKVARADRFFALWETPTDRRETFGSTDT
jgi:hypothetical protein